MSAKVCIIWDYDAAIGQVNSSYPYNFHEESILTEIHNVEKILSLARERGLRMTFAVTGFAAESGQFPYHVPDQIREIAQLGHEIASHSWRHEWFPFLTREQIRRSLKRSKEALERCLGQPDAVKGFVPPFSRPMSWYGRLALSLGDRAFGPAFPGANLGSLLKLVSEAGYQWCRVVYRSLWRRFTRRPPAPEAPVWLHHIACIPQHTCGFGDKAMSLLNDTIKHGRTLVVTGHPLGLSLPHDEHEEKLKRFLNQLADMQARECVKVLTVQELLGIGEIPAVSEI